MTKRPSTVLKPIQVERASSKRSLEPIGIYDPYRPRVFGTLDEQCKRRASRDHLDMVMTNEAFAAETEREIAARTKATAAIDAINVEASLEAERRARKFRVTRS